LQEQQADIVIIGGGGAGICAGLTAVEHGITSVIILEKRFMTGGNSALAGGFLFGVESPPQKRAKVFISKDTSFQETMTFHHYDRVDSRVVRAWINKTGDTIRWLEEYGIKYTYMQGVHDVHQLADLKVPAGGMGAKLKILAEKFTSGGGKILVNTSGKQIVRARNGKVTGLIATPKSGDDIHIKTNCVIIATGGFTGSRKLLKQYFPFYYDEDVYGDTPMVPNMGEGMILARDAGTVLNDYATLIREPIGMGSGKRKSPKSGTLDVPLVPKGPGRASGDPRSIWVNKYGVRFMDENHGFENICSNAILWQPGKTVYALFDDEIVERMMEPDPDAAPGLGNTAIQHVPGFRQILIDSAGPGGVAAVADTWDGIAAWIGADAAVLKATVAEYNACCKKKYDDLFLKDQQYLVPLLKPPFYATKFGPMLVDTIGPVRVNERMENLGAENKPVPGLYTAGVIAGGWQGYDYYHFGAALSWALSSGRIAGESAVNYLRSINRSKEK